MTAGLQQCIRINYIFGLEEIFQKLTHRMDRLHGVWLFHNGIGTHGLKN